MSEPVSADQRTRDALPVAPDGRLGESYEVDDAQARDIGDGTDGNGRDGLSGVPLAQRPSEPTPSQDVPKGVLFGDGAVSYSPLRTHETKAHLV